MLPGRPWTQLTSMLHRSPAAALLTAMLSIGVLTDLWKPPEDCYSWLSQLLPAVSAHSWSHWVTLRHTESCCITLSRAMTEP
eukprot:365128-Chlamydomonas_euryale.AAC.2